MKEFSKKIFKKYFLLSKNKKIRELSEYFLKKELTRRGIFKPHPEERIIKKYIKGKGIDVGCGGSKITPSTIGVDLTPLGEYGNYGSQQFLKSQAEICSIGDNLYMFKDESLNYVVSRHCLEHFKDFISPLIEWKRVLKKGGILAISLPDDNIMDTIKLDPTHKHVFTPEIFEKIINLLGDFEKVEITTLEKSASFVAIFRKK